MTKQERIVKKIEDDKELMNKINSMKFYSIEAFYDDAKRWIKGIKENAILCIYKHTSRSGMTRRFKYIMTQKGKGYKGVRYHATQFYSFHKALGYRVNEKSETTIDGCGMDMNFHLNYTIIHTLHRLGFISYKQCDWLAQQTPTFL